MDKRYLTVKVCMQMMEGAPLPHLRRLELETKLLKLRVALLKSVRLTTGLEDTSPFACLALLIHGLSMDAHSGPIYEEILRHCDKLLSQVQTEMDGCQANPN